MVVATHMFKKVHLSSVYACLENSQIPSMLSVFPKVVGKRLNMTLYVLMLTTPMPCHAPSCPVQKGQVLRLNNTLKNHHLDAE